MANFVIREGELSRYSSDGEARAAVPEGVTRIGVYAFRDCLDLLEVRLPESLVSVGAGAFAQCRHLRKIEFPDSVEAIGTGVCRDCCDLQSAVLSKQLRKVPLGTFSGCRSLREIFLPDSTEIIGSYAFFGCASLRKIRFSAGLTLIPENAFAECGAIAEFAFAEPPQPGSALFAWLCGYFAAHPEMLRTMYRDGTLTRALAEAAVPITQESNDTELTALMLNFLHDSGGDAEDADGEMVL